MSEERFPIGHRIELPGHFAEPVILESVRPLGGGYEGCVALISFERGCATLARL